jgi:multiple sugar transport system permease protein
MGAQALFTRQKSSPAGQKTTQHRMSGRTKQRTLAFYLFTSPWWIGFILLGIFPLVVGLLISFSNYDGLNFATVKLVGLKNYQRAFTDPDVTFSIARTLLWVVVNLPTWMILSFLLALILNQDVKGRGLFRTLYYIPSVIPGVAAVAAWGILLDKNYGLLNGLVSVFRPGTAIGWMSDYAMIGMAVIAIWGGLGGGMLIFLAGLQDIPDELIEAARIDGANRLQIFWHITLPLMTPIIFYQLVMGLIGAFQQLTLPLLVTKIATNLTQVPPRGVYLYMIHVWQQIYSKQRYMYGNALMWLLFIVVVIVTLLIFWSAKFWVYQAGEQEGEKS